MSLSVQVPVHDLALALAPLPTGVSSPFVLQPTANSGPVSRVQIPLVYTSLSQHSYLQVVRNPPSYTVPQALGLEDIFSSSRFCTLTLQKVQHTSLLLTEMALQVKKSLLSFFTPLPSPKDSCLSPRCILCYMLTISFIAHIYIDYQAKVAIKIHLFFFLENFTIFLLLVNLITIHFLLEFSLRETVKCYILTEDSKTVHFDIDEDGHHEISTKDSQSHEGSMLLYQNSPAICIVL